MSKNLGIAYSMKRKKMAKGGDVKNADPLADKGAKIMTEGRHYAKQAGGEHAGMMLDAAKEQHSKKLASIKAMPKPKLQGLASGGNVESSIIKPRRIDAMGRDKDAMDDINNLVPMEDAEEDMAMHPAHLEYDNDEMGDKDAMSGKMKAFADGGMAEADSLDEEEMEHAASLAAAIMAKRKRMAEGGEVDLAMNAEEEPNNEDQMSFEALKKENYDESSALDDDQPDDSNEHGHAAMDEDDRSIVSAIRRKMKMKSAISK